MILLPPVTQTAGMVRLPSPFFPYLPNHGTRHSGNQSTEAAEMLYSKASTLSINPVKPRLPLRIHQEGTKWKQSCRARPVLFSSGRMDFFSCAHCIQRHYTEVLIFKHPNCKARTRMCRRSLNTHLVHQGAPTPRSTWSPRQLQVHSGAYTRGGPLIS